MNIFGNGSNIKKRNNQEQSKISDGQLNASISKNISIFMSILSNTGNVQFRNFEIQIESPIKCCAVFIDEMTNSELINKSILRPLMEINIDTPVDKKQLLDFLLNKKITSNKIRKSTDIDELIGSILYGDAVILIDGISEALLLDSTGWQSRPVGEPITENVVRGPREGFTESMKINMSLIRRRLRDPKLKFEFIVLGTKTRTKVAICYMEGIANGKILNELKRRLGTIKMDGILESGYIEELIKDNPASPFKTIGNSERPDVVAGKLLEGKIAVICDGTPYVLTLPYIFLEYFQSSEDYYNSFIYGSFNRMIRIAAFFLSTSIPAMYVALVSFHQEMIPTPLLLSITSAREGVPFPTVVETLFMLFVFEVIREAGVRMPSTIGQSVSIVGALVLGDAAVNARFISAPIVIITALTGIGSFLLPKMLSALVILRTVFVILASILGIYGYIFGIILVFLHLMSIESFGVPYMTNSDSWNKYEIQDAAIRAPWWYMYYKPVFISNKSSISTQKDGGSNGEESDS
jgi:spore germination protein KA